MMTLLHDDVRSQTCQVMYLSVATINQAWNMWILCFTYNSLAEIKMFESFNLCQCLYLGGNEQPPVAASIHCAVL